MYGKPSLKIIFLVVELFPLIWSNLACRPPIADPWYSGYTFAEMVYKQIKLIIYIIGLYKLDQMQMCHNFPISKL